jgi:hypothetical protein
MALTRSENRPISSDSSIATPIAASVPSSTGPAPGPSRVLAMATP